MGWGKHMWVNVEKFTGNTFSNKKVTSLKEMGFSNIESSRETDSFNHI